MIGEGGDLAGDFRLTGADLGLYLGSAFQELGKNVDLVQIVGRRFDIAVDKAEEFDEDGFTITDDCDQGSHDL